MKYLAFMIFGFGFLFKAEVSDPDSIHLYKNWRWHRWEAASNQQVTYKPSLDFGNFYGFQFRKDNTFSICRGISYYPSNFNLEFEVADGEWIVEADSMISLFYTINN